MALLNSRPARLRPRRRHHTAADNGATTTGTWGVILAIASQTTVLLALLYRIGWVRTNATASYFNIDTTMLDLNASDYVLRSLNSALRPIILFLVLFVGLQILHWRVQAALMRRHGRLRLRSAIRAAGPIGLCLLAAGSAVLLTWDALTWPFDLASPLAMFAGAALVAYHRQEIRRNPREKGPSSRLGSLALVSLGLFGFLLTIEQYADHVGRTIAANDAANLASRPMVLLHSTKQLDIVGDGITLAYDASPEQNYHYRYLGLRQLLHTRTRYFLVSAHWTQDRAAVYCVQDTDSVRIDFVGA